MALNKAALATSLLNLYNAMKVTEYTETQFANAMADIIDAYIKTATVTGTATGVQSGGSSAPVTGALS